MLLHYAAKWGDVATLRRLVAEGRSVDERGRHGESPLFWAAESPRAGVETIEALLAMGARPDVPGWLDRTPLGVASDADKVTALLRGGADAKRIAAEGYNTLMAGPMTFERVRRLLDAGADPNVASDYGETALESALRRKAWDVVRLLIERGADPMRAGGNALNQVILVGSVADVEAALAEGNDPHEPMRLYPHDAWRLALIRGDIAKAEAILKGGADPMCRTYVGETSLITAVEGGRVEIVNWLLALGIPVNERGYQDRTALGAASDIGDVNLFDALLNAGAEVNLVHANGAPWITETRGIAMVRRLVEVGASLADLDEYETLRQAADEGNGKFVRELVALGVDVNGRGGENALHPAVRDDERELVRFLLSEGANPNALTNDGESPLFRAKSLETARILLQAGADPSIEDDGGNRAESTFNEPELIDLVRMGGPPTAAPLIDAVKKGDASLVRYMLSRGIPVNAAEPWGATALMAAAERSDAKIVALLLEAGADVAAADNKGRTALHYATVPEADMETLQARIDGNEGRGRAHSAAMRIAFRGSPRNDPDDAVRDSTDMLALLHRAGADLDALRVTASGIDT